jgi:hypothetical protein
MPPRTTCSATTPRDTAPATFLIPAGYRDQFHVLASETSKRAIRKELQNPKALRPLAPDEQPQHLSRPEVEEVVEEKENVLQAARNEYFQSFGLPWKPCRKTKANRDKMLPQGRRRLIVSARPVSTISKLFPDKAFSCILSIKHSRKIFHALSIKMCLRNPLSAHIPL